MIRLACFALLFYGVFIEAAWATHETNENEPTPGLAGDPAKLTQALLTDPAARQEALQRDPKANSYDQTLRNSFGTLNTEEIYKLSSEMFDKLDKETGGDPAKMMEILTNAQRDPSSVKKYMTPEQMQKIRDMANQIDNAKKP